MSWEAKCVWTTILTVDILVLVQRGGVVSKNKLAVGIAALSLFTTFQR